MYTPIILFFIGSLLFVFGSAYISSKIFKIAGSSEIKGAWVGSFTALGLLGIILALAMSAI